MPSEFDITVDGHLTLNLEFRNIIYFYFLYVIVVEIPRTVFQIPTLKLYMLVKIF